MKKLLLLTIISISLLSCKKDDAPTPPNMVNLSASELGFEATDPSKTFQVVMDRSEAIAVDLVFDVVLTGLPSAKYSTLPVITNNTMKVNIPIGKTSADVKISKTLGATFSGDEVMTFTLKSASNVKLGAKNNLKLKFGTLLSTGAKLRLEGGGEAATHTVYVDLSNNEATAVVSKSWNLALSTGADFGVMLNNSTSSTAIEARNQTMETAISASDLADYGGQLVLGRGEGNLTIADDVNGDLSKSVIKEGKVYVVNLGENQTPLYRVKVAKKDANSYTIQYAKGNEAGAKSLDATKNSLGYFVYASLIDHKTVLVEPEKKKWDIVWGKMMYKTKLGDVFIPYSFSDLVYINTRDGVEVAEVLVTTVTYDKYANANVASSTFSKDRDAIGSKWRAGGGPSSSPMVKSDRFYVVKDPAGNIYKLRFVSMSSADGGERGRPEIEYALVK